MILPIKKMPINEFRESGYLQELNRQFLHPLGLALEVDVEEDGSEKLSGIWDCRDDSEGIVFNINHSDEERRKKFLKKSAFIKEEKDKRKMAREQILGFFVEPINALPQE